MRIAPSILLSALLALPGLAHAKPAPENPHISLSEAATIALDARPGRVMDSAFERSFHRGSRFYSFRIMSLGVTYSVAIDPRDGSVISDGPVQQVEVDDLVARPAADKLGRQPHKTRHADKTSS